LTALRPLATIGYEAATMDRFLTTLKAAGVDLLVDVRAVASSRRPGFSKTKLAENLAGVGIGYLHLRSLGTPADGRAAARAGRYDELRTIYEEHLGTETAREGMQTLEDVVRERSVCLLCFEDDPAHCHRSLIGDALDRRLPLAVQHLIP
jgi:uncharacterized protein (DUF488 family)